MTARSATEEELVAACQRGLQWAQHALYHRYAKAMLNTAYRILNNREDAQDVLQESFLKVFQRIHSYRGESTIGAWIKRIVVNTSLNQAKRRGLQIVGGLEVVESQAEPSPEPEDFELDVRIAREALAELPAGYRTVLTLYLIEGYDHKEIAEILGVNISTSLSQYSRGKKKLKELLLNRRKDGSNRKVLRYAQG